MNYGDKLKDRVRLDRVGPKVGNELRGVVAPMVAPRTRIARARFELWGRSFVYCSHPYNTTYRNERAVEIPLAVDFLARRGEGRGMEFGNVLTHYGFGGERDIVDKYERAEGTRRCDVLDYRPRHQLDYIVSISTLEHVGWDEHPRDPDKVGETVEHLHSLLAPGGAMLITAPLGHNPHLDEAILRGRWPVRRQATLVRVGGRRRNRWESTRELEFRPYFGRGGRGADALWVAEFAADAAPPQVTER